MKSILCKSLLWASCLLSLCESAAQPVSIIAARQIACNGYAERAHEVPSSIQITAERCFARDKDTLLYLFQINERGFVLVANEQRVLPILAYGFNGGTHLQEMPPTVASALEQYQDQIRMIRVEKNGLTIQEDWARLQRMPFVRLSFNAIELPIETQWGQTGFYKEACPRQANGTIAATGCTATAMAQLMKYYRHPAKGSGATFLAYNQLGADNLPYTGAEVRLQTYYDWAQMPNQIQQSNPEIAMLMYHCGRAARSLYSASSTISTPNDAERSLQDFFYYQTQLIRRQDTALWFQTLRHELNRVRPVLYTGYTSNLGHLWLCTGYNELQQLKMNWGWNGAFDGFYHVNALNPAQLDLNLNQFMVTAKPIYPTLTLVTPMNAPTQVVENQAFQLQTLIKNNSNQDFQGDIEIVVQDQQGMDVGILDIKRKHALNATRWQNFNFNTPHFDYNVGNYQLGLRYRQWNPMMRHYEPILMTSPLGFLNPMEVEVLESRLDLNTEPIDFQYIGGNYFLNVKSNAAWNVSTNATWLMATQTANQLSLQCAPNEGAPRTAQITIAGANRAYTIDIKQAARHTTTENLSAQKKWAATAFPNPTQGQVTLQWWAEVAQEHSVLRIQNSLGQMIKTFKINVLEGFNETVLDLNDCSMGAYQARVGAQQWSFIVYE